MKQHIQPIAMKANDTRVLIRGEPVPRDFRIIAEDEYQLLYEAYIMAQIKNMAILFTQPHINEKGEPNLGTIWKHVKSGNLYRVIQVGLIEDTLAPAVVYTRLNPDNKPLSDAKWIRLLPNFMDGRFVPWVQEKYDGN